MEGAAAALQLLRSQDRTHLPVAVEEPDPIGGQLQQSSKVFLQVAHRLLQTEADGLHPVTPANIHHDAAGAQVHLHQWGQLTILGYKDVVPGRKHVRSLNGFAFVVCKKKKMLRVTTPCELIVSATEPREATVRLSLERQRVWWSSDGPYSRSTFMRVIVWVSVLKLG